MAVAVNEMVLKGMDRHTSKANNKPDSVVFAAGVTVNTDNHLSERHTRMFKPAQTTVHAYFALLPVGFAPAPCCQSASCALTARFHPYLPDLHL